MTLEEYLEDQYHSDSQDISTIEEVLREVAKLFEVTYDGTQFCWPYELRANDSTVAGRRSQGTFAGSQVAYLSGPITSGPRYIDALKNGASQSEFEQIKRQNCEEIISEVKKLRSQRHEIVIEPASLQFPEWSQSDYHALWERLIERHIRLVILMPGWQYSIGCAIEFAHASAHDIRTETLAGAPVSIDDGVELISAACDELRKAGNNPEFARLVTKLSTVVTRLRQLLRPASVKSDSLRKDASLNLMAERGFNVAQFVSFAPRNRKPELAFGRIAGQSANARFVNLRSALEALLNASAERSINVRSFHPHDAQSREFIYGLKNIDTAASAVERLSGEGLHTIVNETIDVTDGGVSGVLMGGVLEFAPDDTPRCVEKPGTVSLPRVWGQELLSTVYSFPVALPFPYASRVEFSLHPRPCGWRKTNILVWEYADQESLREKPQLVWPNKFSRLIGDKAFGLLVAHHLGLPVPWTTVVSRRIAPFSFGRSTDWNEHWIRTAPPEQAPGLFSTHRGWRDPFVLLQGEDPEGHGIASVLSQAGVNPAFSGALIVGADGTPIIEGRPGTGDALMLGEAQPEDLPGPIIRDVRELYSKAVAALGPVRFEWVHDRKQAWIVQLHRGATETDHMNLTSGDANDWIEFDITAGLAALRLFLAKLPVSTGVVLKGRVGLTSHLADLVRKAKVPAKIAS
jgi:hypothetical protein